MAKKSKWLLGCGLGCAGILAVIVLIMALGIFVGRDARRGFETAETARQDLEEKFGAPGDFIPAADGSIPAERLEIFLSVREATKEYRTSIARFFSEVPVARGLDDRPFGEKMRSIFRTMRSAVEMGADIGHLLEARNEALLDKGMGIGEYKYLYILSYYSWLGHSPDDGPSRNRNRSYVAERAQSQMHQDLIRMLSSQLDSPADSDNGEEWDQWRSDLADEIEKMKSDSQRIPWEDSVPQKTAESLEPFRQRLEQSYSPITNPFEFSLPSRQNLFSINAE